MAGKGREVRHEITHRDNAGGNAGELIPHGLRHGDTVVHWGQRALPTR